MAAEAVDGKYHDFNCCDWTLGVDALLARYEADRTEIVNLILSDPEQLVKSIWKGSGPLAIDNECRCQMGTGQIRSQFACAQCKNLRRLTDFRLGGVDRGFQIECGEAAGQSLIVIQSGMVVPFLEWQDGLADKARRYVQQYHNLRICGTPDLSRLRCIAGDSFTIRTLILWMIESIFKAKGLPHYPQMHTAFICRGTGYSVYAVPTIGTMSALHRLQNFHQTESPRYSILHSRNNKVSPRSLPKEDPLPNGSDLPISVRVSESEDFAHHPLTQAVARTIIVQLLVILRELTSINFSHGTPSIDGLIFTRDPVSYEYDGVHVEGPLTVQITDLGNASATFNQVHYFTKNLKILLHLEQTLFAPEIETRIVSMAHCHDVNALGDPAPTPIICPATFGTCPDATTYAVCKPRRVALYCLRRSTLDIYGAMRHIGFPLYVGSFDFYAFMVSLMCDPSFYEAVTQDEKLYRLWSMMWLEDDLQRIEIAIKANHRTDIDIAAPRIMSNTTLDIIRGAWLRCDMVEFMWSLIKAGW